ncbi:MAG: HAMP domain-containing sensor histidine kinase [Planctomycetota bacterium]|nr:HAMP domain-containing sensor histidine kinase [Planctomycetota bacterium]
MTIINYAKIGMRQQDQETRDRALQKIHDAGIKAAEITKVILGSARNRSDKREPTELKPVVEQVILLMEREMRKYQISLETDLHEVPEVWASGNQIQQVLINLLVNSRQAIGSGGTITVSLLKDSKNQCVDIRVQDNGPGMPTEVLTKIFEPRFSTKDGPDESGKGGSGFGLYNCRQIIEAHQGKIRVASTVGKGTLFTIKLNQVQPAPPIPTSASPIGSIADPGHLSET